MPPDQTLPVPRFRAALRAAAVACTLFWCVAAGAASPGYAGRRVTEVLHELGLQGLRLIYSSEAVPESLRVLHEPVGDTPDEVLAEVLAPHGLQAKPVGRQAYAIVRAQPPSAVPAAPEIPVPRAAPVSAQLEEIVVASSRYSLSADVPDAHTLLTQDEIEGLPRFADDALKAVHRLPGAASNGLSGLANIRGGETNETLVVLDGLPLYDPFHLQLLLSPASLLDPRTLSGLDVHAGGFTAEYGDRMSAVIEATSVRPDADRYYELGLSLFHAQALASQRFADGRGQWLAAARRSNLDEVADLFDSEIGEASYVDGFGRVDYAFSPHTRGSLHVLLSADSAEAIDSAETEFAEADYRNSYFWATLEHDVSEALTGSAILSYTDVYADRTGEVNEDGRRVGTVDDEREYDVLGLKLDGSYSTPRWLHRFGLELRHLSAEYDYASEVRFEPGYPFPEATERETVQTLKPDPSGTHFAAYATTRVLATERLAVELGLRWDTQSYARTETDRQWSPRLNLLYQAGDTTRLRASWGRYGQFQGINELQVEDGIDEFFPTQTTDHAILGLEQELPAGFALRVEGYRKDYRELRPRYESLFDPLSLVPELRWDRVRIDPDAALAEGVEWLLTRRSDDPWNGWLNYTWSRVRDEIGGEYVRRSWDQTHAVGGGLTWTDDDWQVTLAGTYHTGWPTTPVRVVERDPAPAAIELGPRNSGRLADFASVDLRVSREFKLRRGDLTVFADVSNAINRQNRCCVDFSYGYDADGRLVLDREYRHWLPLVPSVGVLWRY